MVDTKTLDRLFQEAESTFGNVITESEVAILFSDHCATDEVDSYLANHAIPTVETAIAWLFT